MRRLAGEGVAIVYISHRMEEIFDLAKTVTVLRDGALAATLPTAQTSRRQLIQLMVGREVQEFFAASGPGTHLPVTPAATPPPALSVRGLWLANPRPTVTRPRLLDGIDLDVAPGEVLGLAGLMGAGRSELLETLFGVRTEDWGGQVNVEGRAVAISSPVHAKRAGLALVTEDRKRDGLMLEAALDLNVALTVLTDGAIRLRQPGAAKLPSPSIRSTNSRSGAARSAADRRYAERRQSAEAGSREVARHGTSHIAPR
jgi:ABC-type sugar transport system ATPase subunit